MYLLILSVEDQKHQLSFLYARWQCKSIRTKILVNKGRLLQNRAYSSLTKKVYDNFKITSVLLFLCTIQFSLPIFTFFHSCDTLVRTILCKQTACYVDIRKLDKIKLLQKTPRPCSLVNSFFALFLLVNFEIRAKIDY